MSQKNKLKTSNAPASSAASVGATLVKQREKLGISAEECANALKISPGKLADLEANNYASYSSEIFVRGHLKNYAKLVGLSGSDIIAIYNEGNPAKDVPAEPAMPIGIETKSRWWLPYSIMLSVLLVWLVVYQMMSSTDDVSRVADPADVAVNNVSVPTVTDSQEVNGNTAAPANAPAVEPVTNPGGIADSATVGRVSISDQASNQAANTADTGSVSVDIPLLASTVPAAELMKSTNTAPIADDSPVVAEATSLESSDSLRFVFSEDCWLEVKNQAGKVVKSGLQRKGTSLSLQGEGPFKVTLGNAKGVSLAFNNEPVVLQTVANRRLLRVVVGG